MTGETRVYVRVEKKKAQHERRLIGIPSILQQYRDHLKRLHVPSRRAVYKYLRENYGINTHTLRYTFITHQVKNGVNPALVSQTIRHSNLNTLLKYISKIQADEWLDKTIP